MGFKINSGRGSHWDGIKSKEFVDDNIYTKCVTYPIPTSKANIIWAIQTFLYCCHDVDLPVTLSIPQTEVIGKQDLRNLLNYLKKCDPMVVHQYSRTYYMSKTTEIECLDVCSLRNNLCNAIQVRKLGLLSYPWPHLRGGHLRLNLWRPATWRLDLSKEQCNQIIKPGMNLNGSKHKGLSHTYSTRMHLNRLFMIAELLIPI